MAPFLFRRLTEGDLPFLLEIRNECRSMLHDDRAFSLAEAQAWFRASDPEFHVVEVGGEPIGYFRVSNRDLADASAYVGADLHPRFRGKGLAAPAYHAFFAMLHGEQGVRRVQLEVLSHNVIAQRLYRKLGFRETGRKKAAALREGSPVDSIVMERTL